MQDFEKNLKRLEEIAKNLRDGTVNLKEATRLFEEGITLSKKLAGDLRSVEQRIEILINEPSSENEPPVTELFPELREHFVNNNTEKPS